KGVREIREWAVPWAEPLAGRAGQILLTDRSGDAVMPGQGFRWFANDEAALEIARVLRPGSVVCLVWNSPDESRATPLPRALLDYLGELRAERSAVSSLRAPFAEVIGRGPFGEVHESAVPHDHVRDRAGLPDNARSVSRIA